MLVKFCSREPESYLEVIHENIQHKRYLKIGNKQLDKSFDFLKKIVTHNFFLRGQGSRKYQFTAKNVQQKIQRLSYVVYFQR